MKKKFILAIFGISLLFMACQEDSYYNDYDMGGKNSSILTEAMKLIEDNHDFVSLPDLDKTLKGGSATRSSGSNQSLRYEEEDFIFDWGEADVMESKLAEVVIAPVRYNKEMALRTITMEGNSRKRETTPLHSMLYMRKMLETGQTHAYILSFAPDRDYINACEENGEELQLYPNPQGSDFSGILFFSTIYGEITHGIRYENGRKCYYIMPRSERNRNFIEQYRSELCGTHQCDSAHMRVRMSMEFVAFSTSTRSTYSTDSEEEDSYTCSFCHKDVLDCTCVVVTECGVCRKQPCECERQDMFPPMCENCGFYKEHCICESISEQQPSNPTYDEIIVHVDNSNVKKIGHTNTTFSSSDIRNLNAAVDNILSISYRKNLYDLLSSKNPNLVFSIEVRFDKNNLPITAAYIKGENKIIFGSGRYITANNLFEEILHATQSYCFYSTESIPVGNIELEAKMAQDMINYRIGLVVGSFISENDMKMNLDVYNEYKYWLERGTFFEYEDWYKRMLKYFRYNGYTTDHTKTECEMLEHLYKLF